MGWETPSGGVTTSSQQSDAFPDLSARQYETICRVIDAVPRAATSWATLRETYTKLGVGDAEYYAIFLKLSLHVGRDWREKWDGARASLEERGGYPGPSSGRGVREGGGEGGAGPKGKRAGALDVLKARLDEVQPVPRGAPTPARRAPSTPPTAPHATSRPTSLHPRAQSASIEPRAPPPPAPHRVAAERDFLVESRHGHSSSDDFVGVPPRPRPRPHHADARTHAPATPAQPKRSAAVPPPSRPLAPSHLAPPPAKSALSTRRPISTASPSAPVNSVALPSALEVEADRFRRLKLISHCFDRWVSIRRFFVEQRKHTIHRERILLLQACMQRWMKRTARAQELQLRAEDYSTKRVWRTKARMFVSWRDQSKDRIDERQLLEQERRRAEREQQLRFALETVGTRRAAVMAHNVLRHWYAVTLNARAQRFHRETLTGLALARWKSKHAHLLKIGSLADTLLLDRQVALRQSVIDEWRRKADLLGRERTLAQQVDADVLSSWLQLWRKRVHLRVQRRLLQERADQFKDSRRLKSAFNTWRRQCDRVYALEERCDDVVAAKDSALLLKALRGWGNEYSGVLLTRTRQFRTARSSLAKWCARYAHVTVDLSELAARAYALKSQKIIRSCLAQWIESTHRRQQLMHDAGLVADQALKRRTLTSWRAALRAMDTLEVRGVIADTFFTTRRTLNAWTLRLRDRRVVIWQVKRDRRLKREVLHRWLGLMREAKAREVLLEEFQQALDVRLCRNALSKWESRVIAIHDREREVQEHYDQDVRRATFEAWKKAMIRHDGLYSTFQCNEYFRVKKTLRRAFNKWLLAHRKTTKLEKLEKQFVETTRLATLTFVFDKWRDLSLRERERDVTLIRQRRMRETAWLRWRQQTKILPALQFDRTRTLSRAFDVWRSLVPPAELVAKADNADRKRTLGKCFEVWRIRFSAKTALHRIRSSTYAGTSPFSQIPPRTPYSRSPSVPRPAFRPSPPSLPSPSRSAAPPLPTTTPYRPRTSNGGSSNYSSKSSGSRDGAQESAIEGGLRARLRAAAATRRRSLSEGPSLSRGPS